MRTLVPKLAKRGRRSPDRVRPQTAETSAAEPERVIQPCGHGLCHRCHPRVYSEEVPVCALESCRVEITSIDMPSGARLPASAPVVLPPDERASRPALARGGVPGAERPSRERPSPTRRPSRERGGPLQPSNPAPPAAPFPAAASEAGAVPAVNLEGMSIRHLRELIESRGLSHADCLEKPELVRRAEQALQRPRPDPEAEAAPLRTSEAPAPAPA